ncbi:MAG: phage baseplate protein [Myxococcota bacterium]
MSFVVVDPEEGEVVFALDIAEEEVHERTAEVALSPVEAGADVADHVIPAPLRYRFDGLLVSYEPVGRGVVGTLATAFERELPDTVPGGRERQLELVERLRALHASKAVTLITTDGVHPDMVLRELTDRKAKSGIRLGGVFQQLRYAETRVRTVPPQESAEARPGARSRRDLGETKQKNVDISEPVDSAKKSIAAGTFDGFRPFLEGVVGQVMGSP